MWIKYTANYILKVNIKTNNQLTVILNKQHRTLSLIFKLNKQANK